MTQAARRLTDTVDGFQARFLRSVREGCLDRLTLFGEVGCSALSTSTWPTPMGSGTIRGSGTSWHLAFRAAG